MKQKGQSGTVKKINTAVALIRWLSTWKKRANQKMEGRYSPGLIALLAAAAAAGLMITMLFFPRSLGVADDGTLGTVMSSAGISYLKEPENPSGYFVKTYSDISATGAQADKTWNSHIAFLKAAVWLDQQITGDTLFDIRVLGLLYGILYVPAIYLLVKQVCMRVKNFSEGAVIGVGGLLVFSDVAYLTYFNSFYPEALWFLALLYCGAAAFSFQNSRSFQKELGSLVLFAFWGLVLLSSKWECAVLGFLLSLFCVKLLFSRKEWMWKMLCVLTGLVLAFLSIACMAGLKRDYTYVSKYHAMTRGVLFVSDNPAKTLESFGMDPSYELLADASAYDEIPLVLPEEEVVKKGFLDQYTVGDIGKYYVLHPGKFIQMVDSAIKSCFGIRRDDCGNFEKSADLPAGAKSIYWSVWSTFKKTSAPKTIGYLVVLAAAACLLYGRGYSLRPSEDRKNTASLDCIVLLLLICLVQAGSTVIQSGDAELVRHCFPISTSIDLMTYLIFAELVHKTKLL